MPGIYFHSLFGSRNDRAGAESSGIHRRINRQKFVRAELESELNNPDSLRTRVFAGLSKLLAARRASAAFAPGAAQQVLPLDPRIFALVRGVQTDGGQMLCLHNVAAESVTVPAIPGPAGGVTLQPYEVRWEKFPG
ncbi:MAG: hypothetical protein QM813_12635 [Verrucomicrobiota bacterium]